MPTYQQSLHLESAPPTLAIKACSSARKLVAYALFFFTSFGATFTHAETRYIDDTLYAPLRSGQGLEFRIVHKGVRSGTRLDLLQTNADSGYSQVRTPDGIVGWLPTRFLTNQPVARDKLARLTQEHEELKEKYRAVTEQSTTVESNNKSLISDNSRLETANAELKQELGRITKISENAINLDKRNRQLREENEQLRNEVEVLKSDNLRLSENNERDKMLLGGGLVLLGVIITLIIPLFKKEKRNSW